MVSCMLTLALKWNISRLFSEKSRGQEEDIIGFKKETVT